MSALTIHKRLAGRWLILLGLVMGATTFAGDKTTIPERTTDESAASGLHALAAPDFASPGDVTTGPGLPAITGQVRDASNGDPLTRAHVRVLSLDRWAVTDEQGHFSLYDLPPDRYRLRVTHVAFAGSEETVRVREGTPVRISIALKPRAVEMEEVTYNRVSERSIRVDTRWRVDAQTIESRRWRTLGDALRNAPGVQIRENGNGGKVTASIHGSAGDQVVVTLDGVPLNDGSGEAVDLGSIPLNALQSISIQSGSAGPGGAIGGVIALETRALTGLRGVDPYLDLTGDHRQGVEGRAGAEARWKHGGLQTQVNVLQSDGDFRYRDESGRTSHRVNNETRRLGMFLQWRRELRNGWNLRAHGIGNTRRHGSPGPLYQSPTTDAGHNEETARGTVKIEHAGKRTQSDIMLHLSARNRRYTSPARQWNAAIEQWVQHIPVDVEDRSRKLTLQGSHRRNITQSLALQTGTGVSLERFESLNHRGNGSVEDRLAGTVRRRHGWLHLGATHSLSLASLTLSSQAGLRGQMVQDGLGAGAIPTREDRHMGLEGRVALKNSPRRPLQWSLYTGAGSNFAPASFASTFLVESVFSRGNPDLRPEKGWEWNLGARLRNSNDRFLNWDLDLSGFVRRTHDLIVWRQNYRGQYYPGNLGRAHFEGVDLSGRLEWKPVGALLDATVTLQQARNDDPGSPWYGNDLPFQPRYHGSLLAQWEHAHTTLQANYRFTGRRYTTESNLDPYSSAGGGMEPFGVLDLSAVYTLNAGAGTYHIRAGVDNAFNRRYELIERMPMPGRTWRAGLEMEW